MVAEAHVSVDSSTVRRDDDRLATPVTGEPASDDLALLRSYEPVVRYTAGELFFPTGVDEYVAACSLWELGDGSLLRRVADSGELSLDRLVQAATARPDAVLSLRFVGAPLDRRSFRAWRRRPERPEFTTRGRFAYVGLLSRMIDALFRLVLLARGRVPRGLAAAAEQRYRTELDATRYPYYGRVVRDGGYVVLQYWFFYAMNDWRSSFGGANDHEADWEQVTVYLTDHGDGDLRPAWVAFSAHDEVGADLRRRWDDPDLTLAGDHPVVFAGAGSHSGAFLAGEYVTAVPPPPALGVVLRVLRRVAQLVTPWSRGELARGVGIPFVDYSRGDGPAIGPGQDRGWDPVLVDDSTPWVRHYWGLWGLDTRDRFGGERSPAGPRFERSGTVRKSWDNPLGWAALQQEPASEDEVAGLLRERVGEIDAELVTLDAELMSARLEARRSAASVMSMSGRAGLGRRAGAGAAAVGSSARRVDELVAVRTELECERAAHVDTASHRGPTRPPQAHLRHKAVPVGSRRDERTRLLRVWSTLSAPGLFLAAAVVVGYDRVGVRIGVAVLAVGFLTIESIARRRLLAFASSLAVAVVGFLVAVAVASGALGHWQVVIAAVLAAVGAIVLLANVRDLRR